MVLEKYTINFFILIFQLQQPFKILASTSLKLQLQQHNISASTASFFNFNSVKLQLQQPINLSFNSIKAQLQQPKIVAKISVSTAQNLSFNSLEENY